MYCKKCGAQIDDEAVICPKCGCETGVKKTVNTENDESKTGIGAIFGIFLGIVGLIIGICLYKDGSIARKTFIKGWLIAFISWTAVVILFYIILVSVLISIY